MLEQTADKLLSINRDFYSSFAEGFAATRRRIQPGVRRVLDTLLPRDEHSVILDLGCGSGALGRVLAEEQRSGSYTGVDFSQELLEEARKETAGLSSSSFALEYIPGDLMDSGWADGLESDHYDTVLAFASLHHIPGRENHLRILRDVRRLLKPDGQFVCSLWQFQNSAKLMARVRPWSEAGLDEEELEPGDTLLDWRQDRVGLRYVHLFREAEIRQLADESGLTVTDSFYSDGKEGNLALYVRMIRKG